MMQLRPAAPDDATALARIHIAGWRASYAGLTGQEFLDSLDEGEWTEKWQGWLAAGDMSVIIAHDNEGNPAGFISFGKLKTAPPGMSPVRPLYAAEIYAIYIFPAYWRQKLGRLLMDAAARALKDRKVKSLCLWVVEKNARAVSFYRALGGQKCGSKTVEIGGRNLSEIAFGWRDTAPLFLPPDSAVSGTES